jgi:hypothetical protein
MSVRVLSKVWDGYPGGGTELLALLALADWSDDEGRCFPSIKSIAKKIRLKERQVQRTVNQLISEGFVRVLSNKFGGAPGSSRRYQIVLSSLTGVVDDTPKSKTGVMQDADGCHIAPYTGVVEDTLTFIEPSLTTKGFELPDWVPVVEWNAFLDHRKKLKKPLTSYSMNLAINQLKKIVAEGHQPDDVINEAILRGWQSFFAPKGNASNSSNVMEGVS